MKRKILIVLILLLALCAVVAQLFIGRCVEKEVRQKVLPKISGRFQVEASVERVGVSLLRGIVWLRGLRIVNPNGFDEGACLSVASCELRLSLKSLLGGQADVIRALNMRDAELTIIRNSAGEWNVFSMAAGGAKRSHGAAPAIRPAMAPGQMLGRLQVDFGRFNGRVRFIDHALANGFDFVFDAQATVQDFATWGDASDLSGRITLEVSQHKNEGAFNALLHIKLAPLADPTRPNAEILGNLEAIPAQALAAYAGSPDIEGGFVSGALRLNCASGLLDPETSFLKLTFQDPKLSDLARARLGSFSVPSLFHVKISITNTLWAPQADFKQAFDAALFSGENLGAIIEATEKSKTNTTDLLRNLLKQER